MPSLIKRKNGLYEIRFKNKRRSPKPKSYYLNLRNFTLTDIKGIYHDMCVSYAKREFDPWRDEAIFTDRVTYLGDVIKEYLQEAKSLYKPNSYKTYASSLNKLEKHFGSYRDIDTLKKKDFTSFINQLEYQSSRNNRKMVVVNFLKENKYYNDYFELKAMGGKSKKSKAFITFNELKSLKAKWREICTMEDPEYIINMWHLAFYQGLRIGRY